MSTPTDTAPTRYATRDFTDAGTGKSFKRGKAIEADPGAIENYEAAGLAGDEPTNSTEAEADTSTKPETEAPAKSGAKATTPAKPAA